jgi:hypothetical protein
MRNVLKQWRINERDAERELINENRLGRLRRMDPKWRAMREAAIQAHAERVRRELGQLVGGGI